MKLFLAIMTFPSPMGGSHLGMMVLVISSFRTLKFLF